MGQNWTWQLFSMARQLDNAQRREVELNLPSGHRQALPCEQGEFEAEDCRDLQFTESLPTLYRLFFTLGDLPMKSEVVATTSREFCLATLDALPEHAYSMKME